MAWRLDEVVEHGLIDNTVEGTTTGKIWLLGRDEPLILSLNGDCWRDLAGTVLEFENPDPRENPEASTLDTEQTGIIGDITASRKSRIPQVSEGRLCELYQQGIEIPFKWSNVLYIEWFSEINGRVLIESAKYSLKISDHEWEMDEDMEEAQKLANLSAMRDFLAQVIRRSNPEDLSKRPRSAGVTLELNEFEWEERLKESDRLTDAYEEVLEKYMEDIDSEQKEAFVMGWDGLLGAMAERDEDLMDDDEDFDDEDEDGTFADSWQYADDDDGDEDSEDEDEDGNHWQETSHPLQQKSHNIAMRALDLLKDDQEKGSPGQRAVSSLMLVGSKLAAVLNDRDDGFEPETGFILAVLKRCLNWINEALGACDELLATEEDADQKSALLHLKSDTFGVREGIVELRRELNQR